MEVVKAREIIRILADGVDPTTGEILPADSVYNSPEVIRALFTVLEATAPVPTPQFDPHRNAGKPWTDVEDEKLRDEFADKMRISDIVKEHGRTYGAIESRLDHLGLRKKPFWVFGRKKHNRILSKVTKERIFRDLFHFYCFTLLGCICRFLYTICTIKIQRCIK